MSKMHRAQILLDPDQHDALAEIAQRDGSSISEIVRNVVESWLIERRQEESTRGQLEALDTIREHRQALLDQHKGQPLNIDLSNLIEEMREKRDDELRASTFGRP
jgi:predicted transcriptional regulator